MPAACAARHPDRPWLHCSIDTGHDGTHQAYYANRLHEWPQTTSSSSPPADPPGASASTATRPTT